MIVDPLVFYKVCLLLWLEKVPSVMVIVVGLSHILWLSNHTFSRKLLLLFGIISRVHHRIWCLWLLLLALPKLVSSSICGLALDQVCINFYIICLLKLWWITSLIIDNWMFLLLCNKVLQNFWSTVEKTPRYNNLVRL